MSKPTPIGDTQSARMISKAESETGGLFRKLTKSPPKSHRETGPKLTSSANSGIFSALSHSGGSSGAGSSQSANNSPMSRRDSGIQSNAVCENCNRFKVKAKVTINGPFCVFGALPNRSLTYTIVLRLLFWSFGFRFFDLPPGVVTLLCRTCTIEFSRKESLGNLPTTANEMLAYKKMMVEKYEAQQRENEFLKRVNFSSLRCSISSRLNARAFV